MYQSTNKAFCEICVKRELSPSNEILCNLTGKKPLFDDNCKNFVLDKNEQNRLSENQLVVSVKANLASEGKRFANLILDRIFMYIVLMVFIFGLALAGGILGWNIFQGESDEVTLTDYLFGFLATFCYYVFFESLSGKTPAKYITKTKVIDLNGNKPDIYTCLLRSICRFIPFEAFTFLGSKEGLHDTLSKTLVVNDKD